MGKINELIEWGDCGSQYSLYIKHFVNDEGHKGVTMIFEDQTRKKVTEMVIPPSKFPLFLKVVSDGTARFGSVI